MPKRYGEPVSADILPNIFLAPCTQRHKYFCKTALVKPVKKIRLIFAWISTWQQMQQ